MAGSKPHATEAVQRPGAHDAGDAHIDKSAHKNSTNATASPAAASARGGSGNTTGAGQNWGYSQARVLALGAVLLIAIAMGATKAVHTVSGHRNKNGLEAVTDAINDDTNSWRDSLDAVAKQMGETKDEALRKVLETYHGAATQANVGNDDSWKAQYDRAYKSAKDHAERFANQKQREDSVSDKLKNAYKGMQEQMGLAQSDYQKTYDGIVTDSVAGLRKKMQDGLDEVQKQYKKGKISAKEATRMIEEKSGLAKESSFVDMSDKSIADRLQKAYDDLNTKTREARSSYVKAYDDAYYGGKSYSERIGNAAQYAADSARDAANTAYETVTDLPNAAQRKASETYHGVKAGGHNLEGKLKSGTGAAEAKVKEEYHRGKMHQKEAEQEAAGVVGTVTSGVRNAATSVRDASNRASQACYDAVWDTKTQFDVAYEQAVDYLSS